MGTPARIFWGAVVLAIVAIAADYGYQYKMERNLLASWDECKRESEKSIRQSAGQRAAQPDKPVPPWQFDSLVCQPEQLYRLARENDPPGIQGVVVKNYRAVLDARRDSGIGFMAAAFIIFIGSLPAGWYFLLRRLREISAAIRGE